MKGMKVQVPVKGYEAVTYWVASIVMTCGQLLRLRYDGYLNNSSADFWCDVKSQEVHPIGWCQRNNKPLQPPQGEVTFFWTFSYVTEIVNMEDLC